MGFIKFINNLLPMRIQGNSGKIGGSASVEATGGSKWGKSREMQYTAPTEFSGQSRGAEAEGARGLWWEKLQEFGGMDNYGAVEPDWADIFAQAQKKVKQYYWGSPTSKGAVDKIKASAAERGMSDSGAMEKNMAKMSAEEGNTMGQIGADMGMEKARLGENARNNWMSQLQGLTNYNPFGEFYTPWTENKKTYEDHNFQMTTAGEMEVGICWVAKEIFGSWEHPKTIAARYYIQKISPRWFYKFYKKHGERIAEYVSDKPILKAMLLPMFLGFASIGAAKLKRRQLWLR